MLSLINLQLNKNSQKFHFYPLAFKLDRCAGSCNTINGLFNKACVPNKAEDLNIHIFIMIAGISQSKMFIKFLSFEYKFKFDGRKYNSN